MAALTTLPPQKKMDLQPAAYFPSCSTGYSQCVSKNGNQAGSIWGTSRCLDCMNRCNSSFGAWPWGSPGC
ncbi:membrane protein insertion efficiency factor YidD [Trinickia violacea]|uniref:Membrane protein insertion efficiency factor YidD n=1 Tax=Trinickia violacea TaxID=2571746 RepID=A0A4P8J122_9BURK|nr:membrane protein insertion efficiency factor YidD [Trinickia violacea]